MRKKYGKWLWLIPIILLVGLSALFYVQESSFSSPVYIPFYGALKCSLAYSDVEVLREKIPVDGEFHSWSCGDLRSVNAGTKVINTYHNTCSFFLNNRGTTYGYFLPSYIEVMKCKADGRSCVQIQFSDSTMNKDILLLQTSLDVNGDGYINEADENAYSIIKIKAHKTLWVFSPNLEVSVRSNAYFLEDISGNGFRNTYEEGCNLGTVRNNEGSRLGLHLIQGVTFNRQNSANQIPFGRSVPYVWGLVPAVTSNIISRNGVEVYVQKAGEYQPIRVTQDGIRYVDWQHPVSDPSVQCVPSNIYLCNADATLRKNPSTDVTGQDCSILRGVGSARLFKDSTTTCVYSCVNNKLVESSCEQIKQCKEGYVYRMNDNECVRVGTTGEAEDDQLKKCLPLLKIGSVVIIPNLNAECIGFFTPLKLIIAVILFLIVFLTGFFLLRGLFPEKNDVWITIVFPLLIGLLIALLSFIYFWLAVGIGVGFLIFRWIIGAFVPKLKF